MVAMDAFEAIEIETFFVSSQMDDPLCSTLTHYILNFHQHRPHFHPHPQPLFSPSLIKFTLEDLS